jgi:hypothetical protein
MRPDPDNALEEEREDAPAPGAFASFPFDRATIERFREAFPRARWREEERAWFVPGTTASRRIGRWLEREIPAAFEIDDQRGRDAFAFDPIEGRYIEAGSEDIILSTPYSRTIIRAMRAIPFAWWDSERRAWHVPYRSYEDLRRHWPDIEAAARRNEPEARRRRREASAGTPAGAEAGLRAAERRRHRLPVSADSLPPLERPVATPAFGIVIVTEVTGEWVDPEDVRAIHPWVAETRGDKVWALWRPASLAELVRAWPARGEPAPDDRQRGWWPPTLDELRGARHRAVRVSGLPRRAGGVRGVSSDGCGGGIASGG